jgi:hypothetical protein
MTFVSDAVAEDLLVASPAPLSNNSDVLVCCFIV